MIPKDEEKLVKYREKCRVFLKASNDLSIENRIRGLQQTFHEFLSAELPQEESQILRINQIWDIIIKCITLYQQGLCTKAQELMYHGFLLSKRGLIDSKIHSGMRLFRLRYSDDGSIFPKNEMFHIPISKRHILGSERFSIDGVPCLYLAGSSYLCWEELGCKNFDNCNVSFFQVEQEQRVMHIEPIWLKIDQDLVEVTPLALSCFLEVKHKESNYKEEYIIPQLLMQSLLSYNNEHKETIEGITYLSSKVFNSTTLFDARYYPERFYNVVLPALPPYNNDGHSEHLLEMFHYSAPETYGRMRLKYPNGKEKNNIDVAYTQSAFGFMESVSIGNLHDIIP